MKQTLWAWTLIVSMLLLLAVPASSAGTEAGFCQIGEAPGVTVEPCDASGPVQPVFGTYPGSDRLRVRLSGTRWGAQYLLTLAEAQTGTVLYIDQRFGGGELTFDVAFPLPAQTADLILSVGANAAGFEKITLPLRYQTPHAPGYVNCERGDACPMAQFSDLDRSAWYHDGVHWALSEGVMNGVSGERFAPDGPTSRAMLVTMLWRMAGSPPASGDAGFADVLPDFWYTGAIAWASEQEIVKGYGAERFGPDDPISREQLAVILWRYARGRGADTEAEDRLGQYLDAERISPWALDALRWATHTGLVQGIGPETLSPKTGAVRVQTATMLMRLESIIG